MPISSNNIIILTDYKGFFGSKQKSRIYRGGMDLEKIFNYFNDYGYTVKIMNFCNINYEEIVKEKPIILYTSSEDKEGFYKSFIEDIIYHLEQSNLLVIPKYVYLHTHNNKVAMELLRQRCKYNPIHTIHSKVFGSLDELKQNMHHFNYPVVIKSALGAMSKGVAKATNPKELLSKAKKISRSFDILHDIKELLRKIKYGNKYKRESLYRKKFIVQNFIEGLENDWKVLVYDKKCYVLFRRNRKNDFRASGSGRFIFTKNIPSGILDFALKIKDYFNVPNISLDIGYDGDKFHLLEMQFLYFGTLTIEFSPFYFELYNGKWLIKEEKSDLEKVYVDSIVKFLIENK